MYTNTVDSDQVCNKSISKPYTNLESVSITSTLKKKEKNNYPPGYNLTVYYDGKKMKLKKKIGEGTYGEVLLYSLDNYSIVIKKPFEDPYEEPYVIDEFLEKSKECNHFIIPFKVVFDQHGNPFVIMQEANGDLMDLNLTNKLKHEVVKIMADFMLCFYNKGLIYSDLKLENLLYKCEGEEISFFLGDIGSFSKIGRLNPSSTHPPPETADDRNHRNNLALGLYVFGATVAQLYDLDYNLYWKCPNKERKKTKDEIVKIFYPRFKKDVEKSTIPAKMKKLILDFTNPNVQERLKHNFIDVK